jgi:hypothetical protein
MMKGRTKLLIVLGMLVFIGWAVRDSIARVEAQCDVCIEWEGREVCRSGAGADEREAIQAAQKSACGGNAQGMSEAIKCLNLQPTSVQCSAR